MNEEVVRANYQGRSIREITALFFKELFAGILDALSSKKG